MTEKWKQVIRMRIIIVKRLEHNKALVGFNLNLSCNLIAQIPTVKLCKNGNALGLVATVIVSVLTSLMYSAILLPCSHCFGFWQFIFSVSISSVASSSRTAAANNLTASIFPHECMLFEWSGTEKVSTQKKEERIILELKNTKTEWVCTDVLGGVKLYGSICGSPNDPKKGILGLFPMQFLTIKLNYLKLSKVIV